ncbi:MmcQ/YjbR family DNA-binding protein [Paracoccus sp. (in: a-proteobacteria)]|uniref:MmcQ/YjbR family DNA-binding protein n=1 Tax=Paracoccus sp. TaxID=267 RepID=UPI0035B141CD
MSRELVNEMCAAQPGAEWSDPWGGGHDCWKVGGKIFALIGVEGTHVAVKTSGTEIAELLIQTGVAERAPYFHRSWVALPLDSAPDELAHRVRHSYRLVRAGLPKKLQADLPPLSKVERPAE